MAMQKSIDKIYVERLEIQMLSVKMNRNSNKSYRLIWFIDIFIKNLTFHFKSLH